MLRAMTRAVRPASLLCRSLSTQPTLTLEKALTSSHMIKAAIETPQMMQFLEAAKASTDVAEKWQRVNMVLVQSTLQVASTMGFSADAQGFEAYTKAFAELLRTGEEEMRNSLQATVEQKWVSLLHHGYGCAPAPPLTLKQARNLAIELVDAFQDPELLKQVDESRTGLASRLSQEEKQRMVGNILVQEQMKVLVGHGFHGAEGFAQAQVCLMAHASDAVVTAPVAAAMFTLYARGGIGLVAALRQATGGQ